MQKSVRISSLSWNFDGSEDGDIICIKHRPCKSFLPKRQAVRVHTKEIDPYECDISKEDMNHENILSLLIDEDDDVIDEKTRYLHVLSPQKIFPYFKYC